jgi:hypothetical protein
MWAISAVRLEPPARLTKLLTETGSELFSDLNAPSNSKTPLDGFLERLVDGSFGPQEMTRNDRSVGGYS